MCEIQRHSVKLEVGEELKCTVPKDRPVTVTLTEVLKRVFGT